jgi:hypothetical protein
LPVQGLRDRAADATTCARDQRRPAGEIEHHFFSQIRMTALRPMQRV